MAGGKTNYSIAINLLTENFKRGAGQVKSVFRSMQAQVLTFAAALGAGGIGLSNLISKSVDVARETNRVTTALKNVSGGANQFADNQRFLLGMAKRYGLEINTLTGNYAQFTAAASISGMTMENQRKVFEATSRAVTAFGMSAEDSNGVFLALSQMMSKGKISSEELRLQMGERLPIALQAMAKAAGTTVAGLDDLMKKGQLMSADILPKFAEALTEMTPSIDTDNLETSINRLKNSFTGLTNSLDIQGKYKAIIDGLNNLVGKIQSGVSGIVAFVVSVVSGRLLQSVIAFFAKGNAELNASVAKYKVAEEQKQIATQNRIAAENAYAKMQLDYETRVNGQRLASKAQLNKSLKALDAARLAEQKAVNEMAAASVKAAAVQSMSAWQKAGSIMASAGKRMAIVLKSVWSTAGPMALITLISTLIGYFTNLYTEAKRVKNIFSDYQKELAAIEEPIDVTKLRVLQKLYNDAAGDVKLQGMYQERIEDLLGTQIKKNQDINALIKDRIRLLEATATADMLTRKKVEVEERNRELAGKSRLGSQNLAHMANVRKDKGFAAYSLRLSDVMTAADKNGESSFSIMRETNKLTEEYMENQRVLDDVNRRLEEAMKYVVKNEKPSRISSSMLTGKDPLPQTTSPKRTELQNQQESYYKQLEQLGAQLEIGQITQAEYNKALGELNVKMFAQAKSTKDKDVLESTYFKSLRSAASEALANKDRLAAAVEFEKVQKDYADKVRELEAQQAKGLITQKELNKEIGSLSRGAAKSAASIKGIGDEANSFIATMQFNSSTMVSPIKVKPRDTTFDYKKNRTEILSEELDKAKELADAYKAQAEEIGNTLSDELANAMAGVPDLESKLKIAQVRQDVKDFSKDLRGQIYSGIKDIASSSDRVVSAFSNLNNVLADADASEWEKIMAIWNAMTTSIDGMMSIIKTIETLTEMSKKLSAAKQAEILIDDRANTAKIQNATVGMAIDKMEAETKKQNARGVVTANTAEAASAAGKSVAGIPIVGIAMAAAAVAGIIALFATLPKFARGGVIAGGPSAGDKILARVNSGEMILNQRQQSNLFKALDSGGYGGRSDLSSTVSTHVRAKDLVLTINNYLKSKGKKTIS